MSPASDEKRLSIDSQSSKGSALSHTHASNHGLFTPPRSRKSTPSSSIEATSQHEDSKPSSRTSSAEFASTALDQSSSQVNEKISYAVAKISGKKFCYLKIPSNFMPTGWSNDPIHLQMVPNKFNDSDYGIQGPVSAVLASNSDPGTSRYMMSYYGKNYIWTPGRDELLYLTELYSLQKILRRMKEGHGLQTKPLKPLSQHLPQDQFLYHSLWFWEVPKGWSQSIDDLEYIQEVISGCYQYGLPLSVPMLLTDKISGSTIFFLKSGEEYYIYYQISSELVHIDNPRNLHDILRVLGTQEWVGLETTHVNVLPEHGGPNVVADDNVPVDWTNDINKKVHCGEVFYEHGIYASDILLSQNGNLNGTTKYLVEAEEEEYYIWSPASDEVSRINNIEGLQDVLDILKDPSKQLSVTAIEVRSRYKGYRRTAKGVSAMEPKD